MVTAQANLSGTCSLEHWLLLANHVRRSGQMGTEPSESVGPELQSNRTITATGRSGGEWPFS